MKRSFEVFSAEPGLASSNSFDDQQKFTTANKINDDFQNPSCQSKTKAQPGSALPRNKGVYGKMGQERAFFFCLFGGGWKIKMNGAIIIPFVVVPLSLIDIPSLF